MNHLDNIFDQDIEKFTKSYFEYIKVVLDKIDVSEVKVFIEYILYAREKVQLYFLWVMEVVQQQQVILLTILLLVQMNIKNHLRW